MKYERFKIFNEYNMQMNIKKSIKKFIKTSYA